MYVGPSYLIFMLCKILYNMWSCCVSVATQQLSRAKLMSHLIGMSDLPSSFAEIVRATDEAGGAVIVFDPDDHVLLANSEQRRIMPCFGYKYSDTYTSMFWELLEKGLNGNPVAKKDPELWLHRAIGSRLNSANMDFVNIYPWGRMLVSHHRLDDGTSLQARLNMRAAGLEKYFSGQEANLGVTRALRLRREIHALEAMLDSLGLAVALVDQSGNILHANTSFSDMLQSEDGLINKTGSGVTATDPLDELVLRQALEHVAGGLVPRTYVPIRRRSGGPLVMTVSPGSTGGTAIVAAARFGEDMSEVNSALRQAFGVTATEAEVLSGVGSGQTPAEIAGSRGVGMQAAYRAIDRAKKKMKETQVSSPDLPGIASIVTGIAAIARAPSTRKH